MILFVKKHLPVFLLSLLLVVLAVLATDTAYLIIEMTGYKRNYIQVFWAGRDGHYSREKLVGNATKKGRKRYVIPLTDALFIDNIRVDLQQGRKNNIPRHVSLHRIDLQFKWFFKNQIIDSRLQGVDEVYGIESTPTEDDPDKLTFTDPDPRFEFKLHMQPVYYQLVMPFLFLLLLHYLLYDVIFRRRKDVFLAEIDIGDSSQETMEDVFTLLRDDKAKFKLVQSSLLGQHGRLLIEVRHFSINRLHTLFRGMQDEKRIKRLHIVSKRSCEIR